MSLERLLQQRVSAYRLLDAELGLDEISRWVSAATLAPSAYHLQNWHFTAVRSPAVKQALRAAAYGQDKVQTAAVTIVVSGDLLGYRLLGERLAPSVAAGLLDAAAADSWVQAAQQAFEGQPQAQRDEAVRSASLAAMPLMLAATEAGWASCPMSGFDAQAVRKVCGLSERWLPVLLLAIGKSGAAPQRQKIRVAAEDVLMVL